MVGEKEGLVGGHGGTKEGVVGGGEGESPSFCSEQTF